MGQVCEVTVVCSLLSVVHRSLAGCMSHKTCTLSHMYVVVVKFTILHWGGALTDVPIRR